MYTILLVLTVYIAGAFLIGIPMGKKSMAVWDNAARLGSKHGFWEHFLFPFLAPMSQVGVKREAPPSIQFHLEDSENGYITCIAFNMLFWPFKILWLIFAGLISLLMLGIIFVLFGLPEALGHLIGKFLKKPAQ